MLVTAPGVTLRLVTRVLTLLAYSKTPRKAIVHPGARETVAAMWTNELLCYQKFNDYWAELTTTIMLFILSREIYEKGVAYDNPIKRDC